jgi:bifunctional enzyme CysN/CysC
MDLAGFSQETFNAVVAEYKGFLAQIGLEAQHFIPISARNGFNVANRVPAGGDDPMPWYTGPTVTDLLDSFEPPRAVHELPLRFPIQDVYRFDDRRILAGRIETGTLRVGDSILFSPVDKLSTVASIERWNADRTESAVAGESIGITLTEQIFVDRGHIASHAQDGPIQSNRFRARLFWMGREPLRKADRYKLKLATQELDAEVVSIEKIIDASTLESVETERDFIARNDVAEVTIQTRGALAMDNHDRNPLMGRFVIMDNHHVAGGGIVFGGVYTSRAKVKSSNIFWSEGNITARARALRNGHKGAVLWFTGLSGSGKSTLARALERELFRMNRNVYVLDGDNIRHGLNSNLGFSPTDRVENIRRVAEVARLMADAGLIVITAFISPYRADRTRAREIALSTGVEFYELYVNAPLDVCETRDTKGLYKRARSGEIAEFTGISAPYEAPENPELIIRTGEQTLDECLIALVEFSKSRLEVEPGVDI